MWLAILVPCSAPRTLKLLCVLQVLGKVKQFAKFPHCISIHCGFGVFEDEDVKIMCSNPAPKGTILRLLVYHMSKLVQRPKR